MTDSQCNDLIKGDHRIIISSMGNLYMIEFFKGVSSRWKSKYISKYISISGVYTYFYTISAKNVYNLIAFELFAISSIRCKNLQKFEI